ncbi:MAG: transporter related [Nocardia sp.]|uniref:ABC transporter ATP-binding protein n=1 Tax=Nocardia sp. TaxID=1821 RepID=UPI00260E4A6B|nr:ABC transporter transmembrane domain-containing protein [Nocardia sp.]MCU1644400.1 transporter related [Nocardia sp.]
MTTADNGLLPQATAREAWKYAGALLMRRWPAALFTAVVLAAGAAVTLLTPRAMGWAVDAVIAHNPAGIRWPVVVLAGVAVAQGVLRMLGAALTARVGEPALATLREEALDRAVHLPEAEVERVGSGDLMARISGDVDLLATAIRSTVPILAVSVLVIWVTVIGLATIDWRFAIAGLCAAPTDVHVLLWYFRNSAPAFTAQRVAEGARAQQLLDSIDGVATVRAFRLGPVHRDLIAERSAAAVQKALAAMRLRTRFYGRMHLTEIIGLATILIVGFLLVRGHSVTVGAATAAALYFSRLFEPINLVMIMADNAQEAGAALARLVGVAMLPAAPEPTGKISIPHATADVIAARFEYDGREVLHGIDLRVEAGEWVAVVGATGAGKSTLVKLVAGVHAPTSGTVRLSGRTVGEFGADLRHAVVLLTQEIHTFAGPLIDDLRLARPEASRADLERALQRVGAHTWVASLPHSIDTVVGQGGHRLTPTQAQEIALTRLLLTDAPIALLDEATAEAGSAGARRLERAARAALAGRTVLTVAHRLTQAADADRIVVVEAGRVAENGNHHELLLRQGRYAQLWTAWSAERTRTDITDYHLRDEGNPMTDSALPTKTDTAQLVNALDMFDNANVGLLLTDTAGTVRRANGAARLLAGWAADRSDLSAIAVVPDAVWTQIIAAAAAGIAVHNIDTTLTRADGGARGVVVDANGDADRDLLRIVIRPRLATSLPGLDTSDALDWLADWQASVSPSAVTLDDETIAAAREVDDFLDALPVAIHQVPTTGAMERTNRAQLRLLGHLERPDGFLDHNAIEFFPVESDIAALAQALGTMGGIVDFPTTMQARDGSTVSVRVYSSAWIADGAWRTTRCFVFATDGHRY